MCLKNTSCKQCIKAKWRLIAWSVEKIQEILTQKLVRTKNNRLVMQLKCSVCGIKKSRFVKEQEQKVYWVIKELKHHWVKFHY